MSENELRQALRELATPVRPSRDGYKAVMRRHHRWRRVRVSAMTLAGVLFVVAAWPVLERVQPGPSNPDAPVFRPTQENGPMTPWVRALIDSPTRGSLAEDATFMAELVAQHRVPRGSGLKVLFAGDVGEFRIVLTAYHDSDRQVGIDLSAPRGTPARELGSSFLSFPLKPYATRIVTSGYAMWPEIVILGLAPQGCSIAKSKDQGAWANGPDPALMVHQGAPSGWRAQVTCDGVVRYQGPLSPSASYAAMASYSTIDIFTPSDAQVTAALEGARGAVPRKVARELVDECSPGSMQKILFGGTPAGERDPVYLGWCRLHDGRWEIRTRLHNGSGVAGLPAGFDLTAPDAVVAAPGNKGLLVVAPPTASKVDVLDPAGAVIESAPLYEGVGTLPVASQGALRATDAAGQVVGTGTTPIPWMAMPLWNTIGVSVDKWD